MPKVAVTYSALRPHIPKNAASGRKTVCSHLAAPSKRQVQTKSLLHNRNKARKGHGTLTAVEHCRGMHDTCATSCPDRLPTTGSVHVTQEPTTNNTRSPSSTPSQTFLVIPAFSFMSSPLVDPIRAPSVALIMWTV